MGLHSSGRECNSISYLKTKHNNSYINKIFKTKHKKNNTELQRATVDVMATRRVFTDGTVEDCIDVVSAMQPGNQTYLSLIPMLPSSCFICSRISRLYIYRYIYLYRYIDRYNRSRPPPVRTGLQQTWPGSGQSQPFI